MRLFLILAAILIAAPAWSQQTGSLKVRFVYGGAAPTPQPITIDKDIGFCGIVPLVNERLLVNADNGGIKNVVLYVYTGRGGSHLPPQPPANATADLVVQNCRFDPRVLFVQVGDTLQLSNRDAIGHNVNFNFFANQARNVVLAPGALAVLKIRNPEPAPIPIECNIHPWIRAYVVALDHPFAGISDDDGLIEISGLPAGGELTFRLYHEAADGAIKEMMIEGEMVELTRNLLELAIQPGENDYGTITIPADAFKP